MISLTEEQKIEKNYQLANTLVFDENETEISSTKNYIYILKNTSNNNFIIIIIKIKKFFIYCISVF